jgi:hypothetical protein
VAVPEIVQDDRTSFQLKTSNCPTGLASLLIGLGVIRSSLCSSVKHRV